MDVPAEYYQRGFVVSEDGYSTSIMRVYPNIDLSLPSALREVCLCSTTSALLIITASSEMTAMSRVPDLCLTSGGSWTASLWKHLGNRDDGVVCFRDLTCSRSGPSSS